MIKIDKNSKYKILFNDTNSVNESVLTHLYLPIIGSKAYQFYNWLKSEQLIGISNNDSFIQDHERIFKYLDINQKELEEYRVKLESFGLLQTYYDDLDDTFYYSLKKPLEAEEFLNNLFLKDELINKIGSSEFDKTIIFLQPVQLDGIYKNISFDLLDNINNSDKKEYLINSYSFDFEKLIADFLNINIILELNDEEHNLIETYFKTNNYSYGEILDSIKNSLSPIKNKSGFYKVNISIFQNLLKSKELENKSSNLDNETNSNELLTINLRDVELFRNSDYDLEKKNNILLWYNEYNFSQFYYLIIKDKPLKATINLVLEIQKKYEFGNQIINLITDFIIFRIGRWNSTYFKKTCQSINNFNLRSPNAVLDYLRSINKDKNINNNKVSALNFDVNSLKNKKQKNKQKTDPKDFEFLND